MELWWKLNCERIEEGLRINTIKHILNTAGIERYGDHQFNMVRLGIGLYGISSNYDLKPIATLTSTVSKIREIEAEEFIGYGLTMWLRKKQKLLLFL